MKRYFAFYYPKYYPCGGMEDFVNDFGTLDEAKDSVENVAKKEGSYSEGHVYDSVQKEIVWYLPVSEEE